MQIAPDSVWPSPPKLLCLAGDEVHVWRAALDLPQDRLRELRALLSGDELNRADRLIRVQDRSAFVAGRGILRDIMGRYLRIAPEEVSFSYGKHGKPSLDRGEAGVLRFNASHSSGLLLIAVTLDREIGIDVERVRPLGDVDAIVERFFSEREKMEFRLVSPDVKHEAFYACWTRKEAYLKAIGEGLGHPLRIFSVSVLPTEAAGFSAQGLSSEETSSWALRDLRPQGGYAAAVAVRGPPWSLRCWQWSGSAVPPVSR